MNLNFQNAKTEKQKFALIASRQGMNFTVIITNHYSIYNMIELCVIQWIGEHAAHVRQVDTVEVKRDASWIPKIIHASNGYEESMENKGEEKKIINLTKMSFFWNNVE